SAATLAAPRVSARAQLALGLGRQSAATPSAAPESVSYKLIAPVISPTTQAPSKQDARVPATVRAVDTVPQVGQIAARRIRSSWASPTFSRSIARLIRSIVAAWMSSSASY